MITDQPSNVPRVCKCKIPGLWVIVSLQYMYKKDACVRVFNRVTVTHCVGVNFQKGLMYLYVSMVMDSSTSN